MGRPVLTSGESVDHLLSVTVVEKRGDPPESIEIALSIGGYLLCVPGAVGLYWSGLSSTESSASMLATVASA
jgi:hypothetical protein